MLFSVCSEVNSACHRMLGKYYSLVWYYYDSDKYYWEDPVGVICLIFIIFYLFTKAI